MFLFDILGISLLMNGLFTSASNLGSRYHGNDDSIFCFLWLFKDFFRVFSCQNMNVILGDTYMTLDFKESPGIAVWDRFTVDRRLRLLCEISVPRNSRNIYC